MPALLDGIAALKATLETAAGLSAVRVLDRPVEEGDEVSAPDGANAVVFVDADASVTREIPYMKAGVIDIHEEWTLTVVTQVWSETGSQLDVDTLATALQAAAMGALHASPDMGGNADYSLFWAGYTGAGRVHRGRLPNGQGHGCRFEDEVTFTCRTTV